MTSKEIELRDQIIDHFQIHSIEDLTAFEIDFISQLENLSDSTILSEGQVRILNEIANKMGIPE